MALCNRLAEVAHRGHFDRVELQPLLSLWRLGRVAATVEPLRGWGQRDSRGA